MTVSRPIDHPDSGEVLFIGAIPRLFVGRGVFSFNVRAPGRGTAQSGCFDSTIVLVLILIPVHGNTHAVFVAFTRNGGTLQFGTGELTENFLITVFKVTENVTGVVAAQIGTDVAARARV